MAEESLSSSGAPKVCIPDSPEGRKVLAHTLERLINENETNVNNEDNRDRYGAPSTEPQVEVPEPART